MTAPRLRAAPFRTAWPLLAAVIAALMLAAAHAFEFFGHYPPCELCLKQRDIYWAIVVVGLIFAVVARARPALLRAACALLALMFLAEAGVALYHAGVEWKWWAGPTACTGAGAHTPTAADMAALISGATSHIVRCDEAAFRLLGVSMAGYNFLAALFFSVIGAWCALANRNA